MRMEKGTFKRLERGWGMGVGVGSWPLQYTYIYNIYIKKQEGPMYIYLVTHTIYTRVLHVVSPYDLSAVNLTTCHLYAVLCDAKFPTCYIILLAVNVTYCSTVLPAANLTSCYTVTLATVLTTRCHPYRFL